MGEIHRLPGGRFPKTYGDERHEALLGTPPRETILRLGGPQIPSSGVPNLEGAADLGTPLQSSTPFDLRWQLEAEWELMASRRQRCDPSGVCR